MLQGDGNYYWLYNPGTSPRDVLVKSKHLKRDFGRPPNSTDNTGDGPLLVFDPNEEADTSLYMYSWSPSGRYWTAILQTAGSDWQSIRTIDTVTCKALEDDLTGAKFTFGATWVYDTVCLLPIFHTE
jgi:prolyl oligopeptidase